MVRATDRSNLSGSAECSFVDLADSVRVAIMITPKGRGSFRKQAREALSVMQSIVAQRRGMTITVQTIFLRNSAESAEIQLILAGYYGSKLPITNYVLQPPCCGAALAIEAWGIGGESVRIERFGPETLAVSYDGVRWIYCAGIRPTANLRGVYVQSMDALAQIRAVLVLAGSGVREHRPHLVLSGRNHGAGRGHSPIPRAESRARRFLPGYPFLPFAGKRECAARGVPRQHRHRNVGRGPGNELRGAGNQAQRGFPGAAGEPAANASLRLPSEILEPKPEVYTGHGACAR